MLKYGDRVKVIEGFYKGMEGIVYEKEPMVELESACHDLGTGVWIENFSYKVRLISHIHDDGGYIKVAIQAQMVQKIEG